MAKQAAEFLSLGWSIISWIEHYLVHGPGDVEGHEVELDDEFAAFILKAYELKRDGSRKIRRGVLSRPKGRAKSELGGMIACAEGLAPVRFDHFAVAGEVSEWGYEYSPGEPVGHRVQRPIVACFATEEDQAGNTYDNIVYMLSSETCNPNLLADYGKIDVGLTRINLPGGGEITPESTKDTSKDGGKETFCIFDETHLYYLPRLKKLHQTVTRNLLKRKIGSGWALETTTMYAPGEESVAEATHTHHRAIAEGRTSDAALLFDHREAHPRFDATKRKDRLAGLKQVYGPAAEWMPLDSIADSYDDPQTTPAAWERYWFNRGVSLQGTWLSQHDWDSCRDVREIDPASDVILSLDGSFNGDSTALLAIEVGDVPHAVVVDLWERPESSAAWKVPILAVEDSIRAACLRWHVVEICYDPYRWERTGEVLAEEGLPIEQFPQSAQRMTPATKRVTDLVRTHGLTHNGDPRLARHVSNAILKEDSRGTRITKDSPSSARKIDLAVTLVMGIERAAWWRSNAHYEPGIWVI